MSVREQLVSKREELGTSVDSVQGGVLMATFIGGPVLFTLPSMFLFHYLTPWLGDPGGWLEAGAHPMGRTLAILFIIGLIVFGLGFSLYYTYVGMERWWERHYKLAWKYLKDKDFALLVIDDTALSPIFDITEKYPYLKWTMAGRPQSLDERIEFASDYWRATTALVDGKYRKLHAGVRMGNLTRRLDDAFEFIFNGCSVIILIAISGPFVILTIPLYLYGVALVLQQQAFQVAMLDYYSESGFNPTIGEA